jgi:hypothetical protein
MNEGRRIGVLTCAEVQDLAGEMGLGVLTGVERAAVLVHLQTCEACQALVEDMAELADSLLLLGPQTEPPAGFETRLLRRSEGAVLRRSRHVRRRLAVLMASGMVLAAGVGVGIGIAVGGSTGLPASVQAGGGRQLAVAILNGDGARVGQAFLYSGEPSWLFMTVDAESLPSWVSCEVRTAGGKVIHVGSFTVFGAYRSWGSTLGVQPDQVRAVMLLDAGRHTVATATF